MIFLYYFTSETIISAIFSFASITAIAFALASTERRFSSSKIRLSKSLIFIIFKYLFVSIIPNQKYSKNGCVNGMIIFKMAKKIKTDDFTRSSV